MKAYFGIDCPDRSFTRYSEIKLKEGGGFVRSLSEDLQKAFDLYELRTKEDKKNTALDIAINTLRMIAQNSYGTELSNSTEENNEILANHYFINQELARETLTKIEGK